jgi:hypothetical protein
LQLLGPKKTSKNHIFERIDFKEDHA